MTALRSLADQLGISISTASRALNGYTDVSAKTRERVIAAADALGYRPHPVAHRLATGRTGAVALVSSMRAGHYLDATFAALLTGIDDALSAEGLYTLATAIPSDAAREMPALLRLLDGRLVDAVILSRTRMDDPRVALLQSRGVPFVTYGRTASTTPHAWVDTDNERAFELATQRLLSMGHRAVHFINGPAPYAFAQLRERGWRRALRAAKGRGRMVHSELTSAGGDAAAQGLLARDPRCTALLCANDTLALGALAAVKRAGRAVGKPGGVSVVGYGNTEAGRYADPALTTIDYSIEDNGRRLARSVLELLAGRPCAQLQHLEPVRLVPRDSDSAP
jgi:LacI family transcriptional regulator